MLLLFFTLIATCYIVAILLGKRAGVVPIVMQLLVATFMVPLVTYTFSLYGSSISSEVLSNPATRTFYDITFAIILTYILSEAIDKSISKKSIKIALSSFIIPFTCGLVMAYLYLPQWNLLSGVSMALLFSLSAVTVLYIYLKNLNYPTEEIKKLVQAAVLLDLVSWGIFGLLKDTGNATQLFNLLYVCGAGLLPLVFYGLFKTFKIKNTGLYGITFFLTVLLFGYLRMNALLFGVIYMTVACILNVSIKLPFNEKWMERVRTWVAIPYILTYGMVQVDIFKGIQQLTWIYLFLFLLPIISKIIGNYLGLMWADKTMPSKDIWNQSVLLNARGLTEIVFLNLLFSLNIIDQMVYMTLMFMGLISTLFPCCIKTKDLTVGLIDSENVIVPCRLQNQRK